ncbi:hypothetical protein V9T40_003055 [Parthenolecanium corni]|uniref:CCHC-type domain-containing protein n=1 Tax=Parthenolecanium corni TaxID=536013 RepID=A0AAN9TRU3_9HEMI
MNNPSSEWISGEFILSRIEVPKDDGRLARRAARRLGIRLITPRLILTRYDELPVHPAVVEDYEANIEVAPDVPAPLPGGMDVQVGVRLQGRQEPLRPLRQRGIAGCEIGSPPGLAGGREIYVGFFGSSSGLSLRERWHLRCEELFGPLPPPLSPAFPAHLEQMFNLRISGSENLDIDVENIPLPPGTPPAANWFVNVEEIPLPAEVEAGEVVDPIVPDPIPIVEEPEDDAAEPAALYVSVPAGELMLRLVRVWPCGVPAPPPNSPPPVEVPDVRPCSPIRPAIEMPQFHMLMPPPPPPPVALAVEPPAPIEIAQVRSATPPARIPDFIPMAPRRFGFRARGFRAGEFAPLPVENVRCFRCHLHGHVSYNCPNREVAPGERCFNCEGLGHVQVDCPEPPQFNFQRQADLGRGLRRRFMSARWPQSRARRAMHSEHDGQRSGGSGAAPGMVRAATAPPAPGPRIPPASAQRGRTLRDRVGGRNGRGRGLGRVRARVPQAHLPPPANVSSSSSDEEFWEWYVNFYFIPNVLRGPKVEFCEINFVGEPKFDMFIFRP